MKNLSKKGKEEQAYLKVNLRNVFGKKTKKIRKEGIIPANIFGPDFNSTSISVNLKDFSKIYRSVKETGIVYLELDSKKLPVLIHKIQRHPVKDTFLHIDFRKINLAQKITTDVPIRIIGQSEAVNQKGAVLLTQTSKLLIEALPADIPKAIEVDISKLNEVGQEIKVADLPKSAKFIIKERENKVIVSTIAHKEEAVVPETTAPTAEVITETKPAQQATTPEPQPAKPVKQPTETTTEKKGKTT